MDLFTIQKLLGHGHISTTGRYLHLISPQFRPPKDMDPLEYLSRYTHRTGIGNERIRVVSDAGVMFTVRADDAGGKRRVTLEGTQFVRRFLLHVLPSGIKRVRHYGVLGSACKGVKLAQARAALQMPAPNPEAVQCAIEFMARVATGVMLRAWSPQARLPRWRMCQGARRRRRFIQPVRRLWPQTPSVRS